MILIFLLSYTDPSFTAVDSNSLQTEVVRGDQISMICSIYFFQTTWYNLKLSSVNIYSDDNLRLAIVSNTPVSITNNFLVSSEVLPSFVCNINFTLSSDIPSGYATNLPQFSLKIPSKQVLCKYLVFPLLLVIKIVPEYKVNCLL